MLDPWIIEEIRRREQEEQHQDRRVPAVIEMPVHDPRPREREEGKPAEEGPRGIVVIDL